MEAVQTGIVRMPCCPSPHTPRALGRRARVGTPHTHTLYSHGSHVARHAHSTRPVRACQPHAAAVCASSRPWRRIGSLRPSAPCAPRLRAPLGSVGRVGQALPRMHGCAWMGPRRHHVTCRAPGVHARCCAEAEAAADGLCSRHGPAAARLHARAWMRGAPAGCTRDRAGQRGTLPWAASRRSRQGAAGLSTASRAAELRSRGLLSRLRSRVA